MINQYIDYAILKPQATSSEVIKGCQEAISLEVAAVCVKPADIALTAKLLQNSKVNVCTVIGFPHGSSYSSVKLYEAQQARQDGAQELDMVINIAKLIEGDYKYVEDEISNIVKLATPPCLKVILECCYLNSSQITLGCQIAVNAGAHFVKTSTGFGTHGATIDHIKLMRSTVGPDFGVKASGGIKNAQQALDLIAAGANRLGVGSFDCINQPTKIITADDKRPISITQLEIGDRVISQCFKGVGVIVGIGTPGTTIHSVRVRTDDGNVARFRPDDLKPFIMDS